MSAIFGGGTTGASEQSQAAQISANAATERFIREQSGQARQDVLNLFPQAQQVGAQGFQGALDVISGGIPQQLGAFQQGNVGAQQITSQTLPQIQNAILGLPVNQGVFTPQEITTDLSFLSGLTVPTVQPADLPTFQQPGFNFGGGGLNNLLAQIAGQPQGSTEGPGSFVRGNFSGRGF